MNTQLQPVLQLLSGKFHWLPALLVWVGALKTLFHFFGGHLTTWTAGILAGIVNSPDPDDDHFLLTILDSRIYKLLHFGLTLFSLPLPTRADYDAAVKAATAAATAPAAKTPAALGVIALLITLHVAFALGATGCADAGTNAFTAEQLTADAATAATSTFNLYYLSATNTAGPDELARLETARAQLYAADRSLAATLTVVEGLRQAYATNAAATNQTALNLAVTAVQSQSSNIVTLVQLLVKPQP